MKKSIQLGGGEKEITRQNSYQRRHKEGKRDVLKRKTNVKGKQIQKRYNRQTETSKKPHKRDIKIHKSATKATHF